MPTEDTGNIVTVDGPIVPEEVGITSTHEHLFIDAVDAWFEPPDAAQDRAVATEPIGLDNLWYVRRNPMQHEDNLRMNSMEEAIEEVSYFMRAGGDTIVDVTPKNLGYDPRRVKGIARETGLNLIHGTAYYTQPAHPDQFSSIEPSDLEEQLESEFISDVREGIDDTGIRAGIVGEIGLSDHIYPDEEAILRAGARAARKTGASLTVHPPGRTKKSQKDRTMPTSRWGLKVLDIVEEEDLHPNRVVLDHMDRTIFEDLSFQKELAERGAYLEYDLWGLNAYLEEHDDAYPSDAWRIEAISELIEEGYTSNLLFGQDVYLKMQCRRYGGFGYGHLLENVVPMLRGRGIAEEDIKQILTENPKQMLTFEEPEE